VCDVRREFNWPRFFGQALEPFQARGQEIIDGVCLTESRNFFDRLRTDDLRGSRLCWRTEHLEHKPFPVRIVVRDAITLDSVEAAAIGPFICTDVLVSGCAGIANPANANNRIGLAGLLTNVAGGNETFFVADRLNVGIGGSSVPEPTTSLIVCTGLALISLTRRLRKVVSSGLV